RRLYRIVLVVNGRSRAGKVVDLIDLHIERKGHVVPNKLEPMMVEQLINVALRASEEIVDTYDVPTISEQSLTEMRAEKAGSPGNQYACFKMHTPEFPLDCPITRAILEGNFLPRKSGCNQEPSEWTDPGTPPDPALTISPPALPPRQGQR